MNVIVTVYKMDGSKLIVYREMWAAAVLPRIGETLIINDRREGIEDVLLITKVENVRHVWALKPDQRKVELQCREQVAE